MDRAWLLDDRPSQVEFAVQSKAGRTTVHVISPAPRAAWQRLQRHDPEALPSQSPEWLDCLCALKGYRDASRLYTFSDGQQLLLPLVKRQGLPGPLAVQASLPHAWGMGGVLSSRDLHADHLRAVFEDLSRTPFLSTSLLPNPRHAALWRAAAPASAMTIPRHAHVIDLEGGFDRVWCERFSKTTRRMIRKAEKLGVVVECDTTSRLAPIFYKLHRLSVDRWAAQQNEPRWLAHLRAEVRDPLSKIEHIAQAMGAASRIWVAWHEGVPIAASLVLLSSNADDIMGAMDKPRAAATGANDLLLKLAIEDACASGARYYHLGESGESVGLAQFKERFGARAYPYHEYRLERLPISRWDRGLRGIVKRAIGFKDA